MNLIPIPGILARVAEVLESRGWLNGHTTCPRRIAEAVDRLQDWAGLERTGGLDVATLAELDAPRFCALPDVMHLNATLCKWPDGSIPYFVQDAFPGLTLDATWAAFDWALTLWAESARLVPKRAATAREARIVARVKRLDGPSGVLAQSQLPCGGISQAMQDYDSSESWDKTIMARLVIAHEVGHALGLDHAPGKGSLMSPYYDAAITKLQPWDVAEIQKRYGKPAFPVPNPNPSPIPTPTPAGSISIDLAAKLVTAPAGWRIEVKSG